MTTPAYDFAAALQAYENNTYDTPQEWVSCSGVIGDKELDDAIIFALKLAAKVMQPSDAMTDAGETAYYTADTELASIPDAFTAMISQACAEINAQKD